MVVVFVFDVDVTVVVPDLFVVLDEALVEIVVTVVVADVLAEVAEVVEVVEVTGVAVEVVTVSISITGWLSDPNETTLKTVVA